MNQTQAAELLELLRQMNQALGRIEKLLTEGFAPAVGRNQGPARLDECSVAGSYGSQHMLLPDELC